MPTTSPTPDAPAETAPRPPRRTVLLAAVGAAGAAIAGVAGCTSSGTEPESAATTPRSAGSAGSSPASMASVPAYRTVVATATADIVTVHEAPTDPDDPAEEAAGALRSSLDRTAETSGQLVFVVLTEGAAWHEVQLPVRPNGTVGWVRARDVSLTSHEFAVNIALAAFALQVTKAGTEILTTPIGLGTVDTPTPGGSYYIKELLQPPEPGGAYGSYAYGLSGFSNVLMDFAGGEGVIGIHGTDRPELIGQQVSSGCIRLPNEAIVRLVEEIGLPLGTPVTIQA